MTQCVDMFPAVDTRDLPAVQNEVQSIFPALFPEANSSFIPAAFEWTEEWFTGRYPGYQAIDARYHDLEHTLQGTLGLARILRGRHFAGVRPILTPKAFELGLFAILMHDTGYLKRVEDTEGTGAKYTATHVRRSGEFARQFLSEKGYNASDIHSVQNMIRCTGVNVDLTTIPFTSELDRVVGFALGTADLLGQMAATDYIEKLPVLYGEFAEAAAFAGSDSVKSIIFPNAEDLMRNTPGFWQHYVVPKIERDFGGLYHFLADPYPDGPNFYIDAIEANISKLRELNAVSVMN
ncbi:MAG TPA: hypothetical protein VGF13_01380 [Verrucomicrobiae bacterium]